jgi:hypothetical protein
MISMPFNAVRTSLCTTLLILITCLYIQSQNLYDYKHSLKFANYLMQSGQYEYAAQ